MDFSQEFDEKHIRMKKKYRIMPPKPRKKKKSGLTPAEIQKEINHPKAVALRRRRQELRDTLVGGERERLLREKFGALAKVVAKKRGKEGTPNPTQLELFPEDRGLWSKSRAFAEQVEKQRGLSVKSRNALFHD